jgi:hypothetical protein
MKKKQIEKLANLHLLPSLSGFSVRGNLLFQVPVGNILRAFLFDRSGFSALAFYPQTFVQLLYIPAEHLTLTPGRRFPGPWKFEEGSKLQLAQRILGQIHEIGLPFLRAYGTPEGVVRETKANPALQVNPHVRQQLAYSLLLLERNDEALDELDKILRMLNRSHDSPLWERALFKEVGGLKEKLMRRPQEAVETLHAWTEQTRLKLSLPA